MKKTMLFLTTLFLGLSLMAQPPKGPANSGMGFGAKTNMDGVIKVDELPGILIGAEAKEVKIVGTVVEVCKSEGCWIKVQTANGPMLVKMKDHAFMVPLELNGKSIVIAGTAAMKETSVEMLRHYAEDAGKTKEEIAAITAPKKEIIVQAKGILVL